MKYFLLLIVMVGGVIWLSINSSYDPPAPNPPITNEIFMTVVNDWRQSQRLHPYETKEILCTVASVRAKQIKSNYSHQGFLEARDKYLPQADMAENLAGGYTSADQANELLQAWLDSPVHLENLKTDYRYSCIKCDKGYCVQIFSNF